MCSGIRKRIVEMDREYRLIRSECREILRENEKLKGRNERMKKALIAYYKAETDYNAQPSTERYGRYKDVSAKLVELARKLSRENSSDRKSNPK